MPLTSKFNKLFPLILCSSSLTSHAVYAQPLIQRVDLADEPGMITLHGSGFGTKSQSPPVLWVFGDDIRENGKPVNKEIGITPDALVSVGTETDVHVWSSGKGAKFSGITRHKGISHSYRAENTGWLGWPNAFGGGDTPYSEKAYISWRLLTPGDTANYKAIRVESIAGNFVRGKDAYSPGERIRVTSPDGKSVNGRFVHLDQQNSVIHVEAPGLGSTDTIGARIVGETSGASAALRGDLLYRSALSGKYLRSYETTNQGGTNSVLSTNRWIAVLFDSNGNEVRRGFETATDAGYGVPNISSGDQWQFLEAYIDLSGDYASGMIKLNNRDEKWYQNLLISGTKPKNAGPTISNVGWEPAGGTELINVALNFGEIYFDTTPQRIVISHEKEYEKIEKDLELQFISSWDSEKIVFEERLGALDTNKPIFVYVSDENNTVNETGFCIKNCTGEYNPPSKIDLGIQ